LCGDYLSVVFPFEHYRFPSTALVLFKFKFGPEFSVGLRLEHVFSCGFATTILAMFFSERSLRIILSCLAVFFMGLYLYVSGMTGRFSTGHRFGL
jgi:hypothetical protein